MIDYSSILHRLDKDGNLYSLIAMYEDQGKHEEVLELRKEQAIHHILRACIHKQPYDLDIAREYYRLVGNEEHLELCDMIECRDLIRHAVLDNIVAFHRSQAFDKAKELAEKFKDEKLAESIEKMHQKFKGIYAKDLPLDSEMYAIEALQKELAPRVDLKYRKE